MRTVSLSLSVCVALLFAVPMGAHADHDPSDTYTDIGGIVYIDDDDIPYPYLETNGIPGLQRDGRDGNLHGHPGHDDPDMWLV